jgi:hypothetical protein
MKSQSILTNLARLCNENINETHTITARIARACLAKLSTDESEQNNVIVQEIFTYCFTQIDENVNQGNYMIVYCWQFKCCTVR